MPETYCPLVLAERDPAFIRYIPALSKRRMLVLERLNRTVGGSYKRKQTPYHQTINLKHAVERTSTITLEMALEHFGGEDQPDTIRFFMAAAGFTQIDRDAPDEMLVRAILSYRDVFDKVLPHGRAKYLLTSPHDSGLDVRTTFRVAKSAHREFFSYEDLSAMKGDTRARFEALLTVLASNFHDVPASELPSMSDKLAELVISRPDRVHDILQYQKDRNMSLNEIRAEALMEYLDAPSSSLSSGVL